MKRTTRPTLDDAKLATALAERDSTLASLRSLIASLEGSLVNHANENEILKRRLFGTKSERGGTSELQLTLGSLLADQAKLQKELDALTKRRPRQRSTRA